MQALKTLTTLTATLCTAATLLLATPTLAQTVSTVAGTGTQSSTGDGGLATAATINGPIGVLVRRDGSVLIAEGFGHRVRKIDAAGIITAFAGTGTAGFTASAASATTANINEPGGLAEDALGNVYIGSRGAIQKVSPTGALSTIAGDGTQASAGDGLSASNAAVRVRWVLSIAFDTAGNLFFTDYFGQTLRKIDGTTNIITNIAGVANTVGNSPDGPTAATATLNNPFGLVLQSDGSILVADSGSHRVRKIIPGGAISTIAGLLAVGTSTGDNGLATAATLGQPFGLIKDSAGNIYVAEFSSHRVRKIAPNGIITTLLGTTAGAVNSSSPNTSVDGAIATATVSQPLAFSFDAVGNMYIASYNGNRVRKITFPNLTPGPSVFKSFANTVTAANGTVSPEGDQTVPFGGVVKVSVTAKPRYLLRVASNCEYVKTSQQAPFVPIGTGLETYDVTVNGPCQMEATFTALIPKVNVNTEAAANALFMATELSDKYTPPATTAQTSSVVGKPVTFKAWVTDIAGVPYASATNVITFKANGVAIAGCTDVPLTLRSSNVLHIREANCTTAFSPAGSVTITSEFAGDTYNFPAVSSVLNHSVTAP
jgi:hypothetical protein